MIECVIECIIEGCDAEGIIHVRSGADPLAGPWFFCSWVHVARWLLAKELDFATVPAEIAKGDN